MSTDRDLEANLARAAEAIEAADALVITAGAGMGVDSGLPDFRGPEGFWRAYPPYRALRLSFMELANPAAFASNPHLAWGFYGHRLSLYRATRPHRGYELLLKWARGKSAGYGVFTSNVDGHFAAAGFDAGRVYECHGSIHHLQCFERCLSEVWLADGVAVQVDPATMRASDPLPACPRCGGLARPNIKMFGDGGWIEDRTEDQFRRYRAWLKSLPAAARVAVIECGAGKAIPTVRYESEMIARRRGATLIRINPTDADVLAGQVSITLGAGEALGRIEALIRG
jgi:NAD-dependent SIR2 family protein deacetylase